MSSPKQRLLGLENKEEYLTLDDWIDYPQEVKMIQIEQGKYKLVFIKE